MNRNHYRKAQLISELFKRDLEAMLPPPKHWWSGYGYHMRRAPCPICCGAARPLEVTVITASGTKVNMV